MFGKYARVVPNGGCLLARAWRINADHMPQQRVTMNPPCDDATDGWPSRRSGLGVPTLSGEELGIPDIPRTTGRCRRDCTNSYEIFAP